MPKNVPKITDIGIFAIFRPLTASKTLQKGGSKLRFGGSYVKIG